MTSSMTYDSLVLDIQNYLDRTDSKLIAQIPTFITLGEIRCSREVKNLGTRNVVSSSFIAGQTVYQKPARWLETVSINFGDATQYGITYRQASSGTRTLTLDSAHDFAVGDSINVFNVGGTGYDGSFTITAITQFTITYVSGSTTESIVAATGIVSGELENRTPLLPRSYEYIASYWPDRTQVGTPRFYADYNYGNIIIAPTPEITNPFEMVYFEKPAPLSETNQTNWFTDYARDLLLYACLLETAPYLKNDSRAAIWKDYYTQAAGNIKIENKERINDASIRRVE